MYREVLAWKGAIFARQQRLRTERRDRVLAALFEELRTTTRELASQALRLHSPQEGSAWKDKLTR